jgi:hypothetical protein
MTRILLTLQLLIGSLILVGQGNPEYLQVDVKADSLYKFELYSLGNTPVNISIPSIPYDSLSIEPTGPNLYELHIQFSEATFGETDVDIEYFAIGDIPGIPYPFYTTYKFRVYPSEVTTVEDVVVVEGGTTLVYPLGNDHSTDGPVVLDHIAYAENCNVTILDDQTLDVNIVDTANNAYISYVISDSLGTNQDGKIVLISQEQDGDLELSLHNKTSIDIYLSSDYAIESDANNGTVQEVVANCWRYTPDDTFSGQDTVSFAYDNNTVTVVTEVYDESLEVQFVKDDEAYVAPGGTVTFNVLDNDLLSFLPIVDYSIELDYLGNGVFEYETENANFSGDQVFFYTIFNGFLFIQGEIIVHVDHYSPNVFGVDYNLQTGYNSELSIVHHTPLEDYSISVVTDPSFGTLTIVDDIYIGECDSTSILNSIIYDPNGVAGSDLFEIEYCTTDDFCEIVRIEIDSYVDDNESCACLEDCIWEGDVNQDGIVNSMDIMELAFNVGETGDARTTTQTWVAQESQDWEYHQIGSDRDLSHSDTNGDGYIDNDDFAVVEGNYGQIHDLLPVQSYNLLSAPVTLIPSESDVDSGDLVIFYVQIGSDEDPIKDFSGMSFNFSIDGDLIDSSSVYVDFYKDSWAGYGRPTKEYFNQTSAGNIDVAFSHIGHSGNTGAGIVAELGFIVEDEIGGLRLKDEFVYVDVEFNRGVMLDSHGKKYSLPNAAARTRMDVDLQSGQEDISEADKLNITVGPNPTIGLVNIAAETAVIDVIEVYHIDGRLNQKIDYSESVQSSQIDISELTQGTYILSVQAGDMVKTVKLAKL